MRRGVVFRCRMLWHGALKFLYYMAYIGIVDMVNASLSRSFWRRLHAPS